VVTAAAAAASAPVGHLLEFSLDLVLVGERVLSLVGAPF